MAIQSNVGGNLTVPLNYALAAVRLLLCKEIVVQIGSSIGLIGISRARNKRP